MRNGLNGKKSSIETGTVFGRHFSLGKPRVSCPPKTALYEDAFNNRAPRNDEFSCGRVVSGCYAIDDTSKTIVVLCALSINTLPIGPAN